MEVITDKARIREMEPNLTDQVAGVLYAPTAGIVCPFNLNIALAENAYTNGIDFKFNTEVLSIEKIEGFVNEQSSSYCHGIMFIFG